MDHSNEEQVNSSKSFDDVTEEKRIRIAQLQKDIAYQKSVIAALKRQLNSYKHVANQSRAEREKNINKNMEIREDLYKFTGIHCVKLDTTCVFQFLTGSKVTKGDAYAVEILRTDGQHRLGKWVMPMSIDLEDIALEYSIENPKNLKPFLKCCKHHIDCFFYRRDQYYQLKNFLSDTRHCFLDTALGYIQVYLHMSGIKMTNSEEIYNVTLYMDYESNRTLPSRMMIETREGKMLPQDVIQQFYKYFKPFKRLKLQEAFEKVISNNCCFQWTKVPYDYDEVSPSMGDKYDEEERADFDETGKSIETGERTGKKKRNLKNNLDNDLTVSEVQDAGENSLRLEKEEERSKPGRKVNKGKARESVSAGVRRKSERKLNSKVKKVNVKKSVKNSAESTRDENKNVVEQKAKLEEPKEKLKEKEISKEAEKLKERVNSKERRKSREKEESRDKENSQEKHNSMEKQNSREIENSQKKDNSMEKENSTEKETSECAEKSNEALQPDNPNRVRNLRRKSSNKTLSKMMLRNAKSIENGGQLESTSIHQPATKEIQSAKEQSEQENTDNVTSNQSDDVRNDTAGILEDGSIRTDDEMERNASTSKIMLSSKSRKRVEKKETKLKETPTRNTEDIRKGLIRKLRKSITDLNATGEDKEPANTATNINLNNIISSTPISRELRAKLHTTQSSEISEILSSTATAKSKENRMIVEQDHLAGEISEEDALSSTNSDDIGKENVHKQTNELLKDIEETLEQGKAMRNANVRKNTRKSIKKKKKKGKVM